MRKSASGWKTASCTLKGYNVHMRNAVDKPPTQKQFLANMTGKMTDKEFMKDIRLVLKQGIEYDNEAVWEVIRKELVEKI
jgi:hypothetical protein